MKISKRKIILFSIQILLSCILMYFLLNLKRLSSLKMKNTDACFSAAECFSHGESLVKYASLSYSPHRYLVGLVPLALPAEYSVDEAKKYYKRMFWDPTCNYVPLFVTTMKSASANILLIGTNRGDIIKYNLGTGNAVRYNLFELKPFSKSEKQDPYDNSMHIINLEYISENSFLMETMSRVYLYKDGEFVDILDKLKMDAMNDELYDTLEALQIAPGDEEYAGILSELGIDRKYRPGLYQANVKLSEDKSQLYIRKEHSLFKMDLVTYKIEKIPTGDTSFGDYLVIGDQVFVLAGNGLTEINEDLEFDLPERYFPWKGTAPCSMEYLLYPSKSGGFFAHLGNSILLGDSIQNCKAYLIDGRDKQQDIMSNDMVERCAGQIVVSVGRDGELIQLSEKSILGFRFADWDKLYVKNAHQVSASERGPLLYSSFGKVYQYQKDSDQDKLIVDLNDLRIKMLKEGTWLKYIPKKSESN